MARLIPSDDGPVPLSDKSLPAPGEEYMNWVFVPEDYSPERPLGMVIQLHGGGGESPQHRAGKYALETRFYMMDDQNYVSVGRTANGAVRVQVTEDGRRRSTSSRRQRFLEASFITGRSPRTVPE